MSDSSSDSSDEGHVVVHTGDVIGDGYYFRRILGQGAFGKVLEVEHKDRKGHFLALKAIRDVSKYSEDAKEEARILQKLHRHATSPYCVALQEIFTIKHRGREHECLVFERLGPSLYEFMKSNGRHGFTIGDVEAIAFQLLRAVEFCHSRQLAHTDLKPENILLVHSGSREFSHEDPSYRIPESVDIRVIDFGGATFVDQHHASIINTRQYRAPEVETAFTIRITNPTYC
jgi:serine/threonine protein kinase